MLETTEISCGVRELSGFRDYSSLERMLDLSLSDILYRKDTDKEFLNSLNFGFIIFSDTITNTITKNKRSGTNFAKYIKKQKLGVITASNIRVNPNSGNKIQVWIWELDRPAVVAWYKKNHNHTGDDDDDNDFTGDVDDDNDFWAS